MSKSWFSIKAIAEAETPSADVHIFDYIGGWGVSARGFLNQLKELDVEQINLHINSPGGEVFDGIAIQNLLKHHKANVTVYIDGIAASIASIIALAGDDIRIADNAYVMIHNPASIVWGEAKDMLKGAEMLDKITDGLAGDYSRKMGITVDEAKALMEDETWYLGQEAVDAGFAGSTYEGARVAARFDIERVSVKAPKEVLARFTKLAPTQNGKTKTEISNKNKETNMVDEDKNLETENTETETSQTTTTDEVENTETSTEGTSFVDVDNVVKAALKADRERQTEIRAIGKKFGFVSDAENFAAYDKSVDEFRNHILDKSPEAWKTSLNIKNPSQQQSEQDTQDSSEGAAAVAKIKEKRQSRF